MTKQQLRQFVLVLVIAFQALAGSAASAASVMGPADMAHCDSEAMSAMASAEHGGHAMHHVASVDSQPMADTNRDHSCDNGCCCPAVCSSAVAILPAPALVLSASSGSKFVLTPSIAADLRAANRLRPPIFA
ncbi:hypothetical protein [Gilvimarinus japonicus]|uniref:CopL family metal-binding regulatory protein n=1 Tax=Gilvimarinus japonicus TaxID=1796469 RepID=A0ABV7HP58_9GAMM